LLVSGSDNGYSHMWNIDTGEPAQLFAQHDDWVLSTACAALPTGQLIVATGGKDWMLRLWGASSGRELRRMAHRGAVNAVSCAVLPADRVLLASGGDDATVRVWDGETGTELHRLSVGLDHVHLVYAIDWVTLPTGQVWLAAAAGDDDGEVVLHVWDGLTGEPSRILAGLPSDSSELGIRWGSVGLAAGPDGRLLAASNAGGVAHVWDAGSGELLHAGAARAEAVAWACTPNGQPVLVVAGKSAITLLEGVTGKVITAVEVDGNGYFQRAAVTSSPSGAVLLAAAWERDTPARIWRFEWTESVRGPAMHEPTPGVPVEMLTQQLKQRVATYSKSGNVEALLAPEAQREAEILWQVVREHDPYPVDERMFLARVRLGWFYLARQSVLMSEVGVPNLARALLCFAPYADEPDILPAPLKDMIGDAADRDTQSEFALTFLRFSQKDDDPALLDAGIVLLGSALEALPDGDTDQVNGLSNLCLALRSRFERDGAVEDLERSIAAGERAVALPQLAEADPVGPRFNLSYAYWARFHHAGTQADLLRTIELLQQIVGVFGPGPERSEWLTEVSRAYRELHERDSDPAPLAQAVEAGEQAVADLPSKPKEAAAALYALAGALVRRYERDGDGDDLRRAVKLGERCLATMPEGIPLRTDYLATVAWFYQQGHTSGLIPNGLDRALELCEQAVAIEPGNPWALASLIAVLQERYRFIGTAADLDRAIDLGEHAVSEGANRKDGRLRSALAGAYLARYQHSGRLVDLDEAIDIFRGLLAEPNLKDDDRAGWASLLGNAYQQRFSSAHDLADLELAIHYGEQAVGPVSRIHPNLGDRLGKLALSYQRAYEVGLDTEYLNRAIELGEQAVAATPKGHPARAGWLANLATAYIDLGFVTDRTKVDLDRAVELGEQAVAEYPLGQAGRVRVVANLAAAYRDRLLDGGRGVDAERIREFARQVADDAVPVDQVWGRHAVGSLALAAGDTRLAMSTLDSALALLPTVAPTQGGWTDQAFRLGEHLGLVGAAVAAHCAGGDPAGAVVAAELGRGVLLANQTSGDLIEFDDLRAAAVGGSVVLINASRYRCDAVIVRADRDPVLVELPRLSQEEVSQRALALAEVTLQSATDLAARLRRKQVLHDVLGWLWDCVTEPVLAALPVGPASHRIWWMPTGYLGVFPLHVAGHEGQPGVLDLAISSFIPSLRTLRDAHARPAVTERRQLVVALHRTPGHPDLPGAAEEAAELHAGHPGTALLDENATTDAVLAALPGSSWAHFACHALADLLSPANGGVLLHDGPLRLPDIGALRLPEAELAYLSACSTAHQGGRHSDEVLHAASAFQLAGFRHVVATLWPVADEIAARAARAFYRDLPDTPTADDAAPVLHQVTRALRAAEPARPDLWATLIHSGP
jgi:WD40 repeat protein/tetratricopeptide (TPR) repeat protein